MLVSKFSPKLATNRLEIVAQKVIHPPWTTFLLGRNIMEGLVVLHETLHELHRRKMSGVIFKIDFENAYDKVNWTSLH